MMTNSDQDVYDLLVVGSGISGTSAALAAVNRGLSVAWVREEPNSAMQSLHWHGYLHRGAFYDPRTEQSLISRLGESVEYWALDALRKFLAPVPSYVVTDRPGSGDQALRTADGSLTGRSVTPTLRGGFRARPSDEGVLDGPRYLAAAWSACAQGTTVIQGTCRQIRFPSGRLPLVATTAESGGEREILCHKAVLATGIDSAGLIPDGLVHRRMSRMLVLRGDLPGIAFIVPGATLAGLFVVPRLTFGRRSRVWLVSDAFWSSMASASGSLDGWWACSITERLTALFGADLFAHTMVGAYAAPKSSLHMAARRVSSDSSVLTRGGRLAVLAPSKWTLAPVAALRLLTEMYPVRGASPGGEASDLAHAVSNHDNVGLDRPLERWQVTPPLLSVADLLRRTTDTIDAASDLFMVPDPASLSVA